MAGLMELPPDLPVPVDDGAADHLRGMRMLPCELLSDAKFEMTEALHLPTFEFEGERLLKRLTMVVRDGPVEHVFYPVFPPDRHAEAVLAWLAAHAGRRV